MHIDLYHLLLIIFVVLDSYLGAYYLHEYLIRPKEIYAWKKLALATLFYSALLMIVF